MLLCDGRQSREFLRQPLLWLRPAKGYYRNARHHLHVVERFAGGLGAGADSRAVFCLREGLVASQNRALEPDFPDVLIERTTVFKNNRRNPSRRSNGFPSVTGARQGAPRSEKPKNGSDQVSHEICRCRSEYRRRG